MFENVKMLKIIVLLLVFYSAGTTIYFVSYSNSSTQIDQLNAQINQLNAQINNLKIESERNDNEDLAAIREMMERDRAEKEAAQRRHEEGTIGLATGNPFHGDFSINVFEAIKGNPQKSGDVRR
jgi:outer membrane murein-binding lipoprotein Lpp